MSAERESAKPQVFRGRCMHCGSKYVVVAYGHIVSGLEVARDIGDGCPKKNGSQAKLDTELSESESEDEITF